MKSGFLIASPQMSDPHFKQAVVLLCHHDYTGAIGLIVNRDRSTTVGQVASEVKVARPPHADEQTWWGGPVGGGTCFVIWKGAAEGDEGWTIGDIAVSQSLERLERLVQVGHHFHISIGYAGWGPHQLDTEIERGSWLYVEADPAIVFETPMADRYQQALALLGLTPGMVWMQPINE